MPKGSFCLSCLVANRCFLLFAYTIIVYFQILYPAIEVSGFLERENQCAYITHRIFSCIEITFLYVHFFNNLSVYSECGTTMIAFYLNGRFLSRIHFIWGTYSNNHRVQNPSSLELDLLDRIRRWANGTIRFRLSLLLR